jgi:hypothetical protein
MRFRARTGVPAAYAAMTHWAVRRPVRFYGHAEDRRQLTMKEQYPDLAPESALSGRKWKRAIRFMILRRRIYVILLAAALPYRTPVAASLSGSITAQTQGSSAGSPFDGTYRGTSRLAQTSLSSCEAGTSIDLAVTNGRFRFAWRPRQSTVVSISHSGGFSAMLRGSFVAADKHMEVLPRIDGHTDGHMMVGEFGTRWCKYSYQLNRISAG